MTRVEPVYAEIGRRLARARERRGLSQEMLGASLSPPLTRAAISNMEGGRQRIMLHVLLDAADALGATLAGLISRPPACCLPRTAGRSRRRSPTTPAAVTWPRVARPGESTR